MAIPQCHSHPLIRIKQLAVFGWVDAHKTIVCQEEFY